MSRAKRVDTSRNKEQYMLLQSMAGSKDRDRDMESDPGYFTLKGKM